MNVVDLTRDLVAIPSVTGDEAAVGAYVQTLLETLGFRVERQRVAEGRFNLVATTEDAPRVVLSTHLDTVPPFIPPSEDDAWLYGRGSCDAKGIAACQIAAAARLLEAGVRGFGVLFTVDEEASAIGAKAANEHPAAAHCRYLINGEPTDLMLAEGSKGSLRVRVRTEGRAAHSAYPEEGESAIEKLLDVLAAIRAEPWPEDARFGETTVNVGTLEGGTRPNVIAVHAAAEMQIRLVTPAQPIIERLERLAVGRARVEVLSIAEPMRMHTVPGFPSKIVRYTTDLPHLGRWGTPLLYGPGSILVAHTDGERVRKADLHEAVSGYVRLVTTLLAEGKVSEA